MEFDSLLKFAHIYQSRIWGGRRLETLFNRHLPDPKMQYGESWEICDRDQEQSICTLSNGQEISLHDLWVNHREDVFGRGMLKSESPRYPLLMKILDACEDLSIQVHPPASVASSLGGDPKTEMWYIVHAEPGSKIYAGLKNGVTSSLFEQSMNNGSVADCVQILSPESGDCLFIPSGMIHAIGAGLLIFEIQQNSDTTFRVFDWNRLGLDGQPRQLHLLQSLQSIDFVAPPPTFQYPDNRGTLVQCDFFNVSIHGLATNSFGQYGDHFVIVMISGSADTEDQTLHPGDFILVPASLPENRRRIIRKSDDAKWLQVSVPI